MSFWEALNQLHFLRPLWLLAVIPATLLAVLLLRKKGSTGNWSTIISDQLLSHLSDGVQGSTSRAPLYCLGAAWIITAIALAGPTWNKLPQPVHQRQDALVIVFDLSLSMLAEDVKPSRLVRARHKILDIVAQRREGLTALIVYSGDAHIVTPLTDDTPTIANLVPALSPLMMPVIGSNPVTALHIAEDIFSNAGITQGRVLLITDGITEDDLEEIGNRPSRHGLALSILGVGTSEGAPIPADEGFLKDSDGNIIVPKLHHQPLEQLAANNDGRYTDLTLTNRDITFLLPPLPHDIEEAMTLTERKFDQWKDRGPLLAMLLIPFALAAFRRGWLLTLFIPLLLTPEKSQAFEWQELSHNLWQTPDQQGSQQLQEGNAEAAAQTFRDPAWKASAYYRAEDFESAAEYFSSLDSPNSYYNRGNALARAGKLEEAIDAYRQALEKDPDMEDAQYNKSLVEKLLEQQQQQQNDGGQQSDNPQNSNQQKEQQQDAQQQQSQQSSQGDNQQQSQQSQSDSGQNQDAQQQDAQQQDSLADSKQQDSKQNKEQTQTADQQDPANTDDKQTPAQQAQAQSPGEKDQDAEESLAQQQADRQSEQQRLATEQWLRQIPDDPSGLLRRKFQYESRLRQQRGETQREQPTW